MVSQVSSPTSALACIEQKRRPRSSSFDENNNRLENRIKSGREEYDENEYHSYSVDEIDALTSSLYDAVVVQANEHLSEWADHENHRMEHASKLFSKAVAQEQSRLDEKIEQLLSLQLESGLRRDTSSTGSTDLDPTTTATQRSFSSSANTTQVSNDGELVALQKESELLKTEIANLTSSCDGKKEQIDRLKLEITNSTKHSEAVCGQKHAAQQKLDDTVNELDRILELYHLLGFSFEKTGNTDALRFKFSLLDRAEPDRIFSFVLGVVEREVNDLPDECKTDDCPFEIRDCSPPSVAASLDQAFLQNLAESFNETNDMQALILGMRNAFRNALPHEESSFLSATLDLFEE